MQNPRPKRKERTGVVISDKMDKTRVVRVERLARHHLYGKIIKKANKFKAHDADNSSKVGDKVRIMETRPLSKDKRWRIAEIIKTG